MAEQLDLAQLFDFVTRSLEQKRPELNQADTYNHDHGDHIIEVFELITQVAKENPGLDAGQLLEKASERLREKQTGTAQVYAQNLAQGAPQLRGKPVTQQTLPLLMQALLGGGAAQQQAAQPSSQGSGDALGGLLGALMGGEQAPAQAQHKTAPSGSAGGDLLGGLLGALMGGGQQQAAGGQQGGLSDGIDLGDIMRMGSAFMQASQSGKSTTQAALEALAAASNVGQTPHRAQSATMVMQALMQAAQMMGGKK